MVASNAGGEAREEAFLSAIVYLSLGVDPTSLLGALCDSLARRFKNYEIVFVDDGCEAATVDGLRSEFRNHPETVCTIVTMGRRQGIEAAMNAGIDSAVGDWVLEIDDVAVFDSAFVREGYDVAKTGYDIVFAEDARASFKGRLFYPIFNRFSNSEAKLSSGSTRLVSRRALNRVHSMAPYMANRKAAYAASGLAITSVKAKASRRATYHGDLDLAVDSLALYTGFFFKASLGLSIAMAIVSLLELVYVFFVLVSGEAVAGWVTTMFVLTLGFFGLFAVLSFAMKYIELLVKSSYNAQNYLVEKVERL